MLYGLAFLCLGGYGFALPHAWSQSMGVACAPLPSPDAVVAQTAGLIIFVLGSYRLVEIAGGCQGPAYTGLLCSVVASLWRWPVIYFQTTFLPKLLTAALYLLQVR